MFVLVGVRLSVIVCEVVCVCMGGPAIQGSSIHWFEQGVGIRSARSLAPTCHRQGPKGAWVEGLGVEAWNKLKPEAECGALSQ